MIREDLTLNLNFNPTEQPPSTVPQLNAPSAFTSGSTFERLSAFKNLAVVGMFGLAGKRVFDAAVGGVGRFTGRNDLQRKIDRGRKTFGVVSQIGFGVALGPVATGAVLFKLGVDATIDVVEFNLQRQLDNNEAEYRRQLRGNRINESRYR